MVKLLIVYHSYQGNTEAMAKAVCEGASSAGATVTLKKAPDATADDLLNCDVAAFGSPNYYSYMAGVLKDYFDRVYYDVRGKVNNKPYGAFTSGGGSSTLALESIDRVASLSSLRMKRVFEGVIAAGKSSSYI
ncbi:MAG: flavodoxin domain-containing protein [Chloroflexota bacterium]